MSIDRFTTNRRQEKTSAILYRIIDLWINDSIGAHISVMPPGISVEFYFLCHIQISYTLCLLRPKILSMAFASEWSVSSNRSIVRRTNIVILFDNEDIEHEIIS